MNYKMNHVLAFGILFLIMACATVEKKQEKPSKPNIIFLLSDDQRDNTFGAMGHPIVKSPNVDKLINNGIRFSNTYVAEPICASSRASLFTGTYERVNGIGFTSVYSLTENQWEESYPELLRKNGYYTGFIGKFGVEYYTFKGKASEKFDYWKAHDGWSKFWPKGLENCAIYADSKEDIITSIMGESIEDFLQKTPDDKPFCLSVSFSVPHGSQIMSMHPESELAEICLEPANKYEKLKGTEFYDTLYRDNVVKIPEETAKDPYQFIPEFMLDQQKGRATQTYIYDYNTVSCNEHYIRYYQQISGMDKVIGDMVKSLKEKGLDKNTVIIFASDHGLLMGEYGMGGKALLYDLASKIPCFIYDPRLPENKRGQDIKELVSSLDITSTILDYAGIKSPDVMQGTSLTPLISGTDKDWRQELFLESFFTGRDNPFCEGIRKGDWKYIRMYRGGFWGYKETDLDFKNKKPGYEQLFNLKDDPKEMNNLIKKFEGSELLAELRGKTGNYANEMNSTRVNYKETHSIALRKKNKKKKVEKNKK
ncbi:sulfatase-like hydrolase/transferase [Polaribacter sp. Q13]|uniref:sulfatase-like hydrolase/transferase n=1 Tax=Polaribacter sp. Q13 TaxID=2806551 RepID=UPI00193C7F4F|nr:sulfatase-like hydrolase/transferase [Polaribacter sp. Q13]QVY66101.1 sulfatase-like hydrolase/transferase [Polaribacter sp. Q13]